jgi:selenocysteine lyase/cysteine desulfurase
MPSDADRAKLAAVRELLPATGAGIYLDTATRGPLPAETAAAMREADDWELAIGRTWAGRDEDVIQRHEEARAVLAALLGVDPAAITLAPGLETAAALAERSLGAEVDLVRHVDPMTGVLAALGRRPAGRPVLLDVSLSAGAIPVNVEGLGADAVMLATDRWLLGPEASAALWIADPSRRPAGLAMPRTALIGLARSVGWLEMYVGLDWVFERIAQLAERLYSALAETAGIELFPPRDSLAAIVSFRLPEWTADEAADELSRRVHALVRPLSEIEALRASVGWFNTEDELDRFAAAVAELARYTPATLPRRPSLMLLSDS